jgi:hypothetical protein
VQDIARISGFVSATLDYRIRNVGEAPEQGSIRWIARDPSGRPLAKGTVGSATLSAGKSKTGRARIELGEATKLASGTWTMTVYFVTADTAWASPPSAFRQPF